MTRFAPMPSPPYYAVIFTSQRSDSDAGYAEMATKMEELARESDGIIGLESSRDADGFGTTISYWRDEASIAAWKQDTSHLMAQKLGKTRWYDRYQLRVSKVERQYCGPDEH